MAKIRKSTDGVKARKQNEKSQVLRGLHEITNWKQEAVDRMVNDDELMKLMYYPVPDWYSQPNVPQEERYKMIDTQIFQYRYISKISERKKSYISIDTAYFVPFEAYRVFSDDFISGYLYLHILCDIDILQTDLGVRYDLIAGRLYELFQAKYGIGAGQLRMESMLPLWMDNNQFGGVTLGFALTEMK